MASEVDWDIHIFLSLRWFIPGKDALSRGPRGNARRGQVVVVGDGANLAILWPYYENCFCHKLKKLKANGKAYRNKHF